MTVHSNGFDKDRNALSVLTKGSSKASLTRSGVPRQLRGQDRVRAGSTSHDPGGPWELKNVWI